MARLSAVRLPDQRSHSGTLHLTDQRLRKLADIRLRGESRCRQSANNLPLPRTLDLPIAQKSRQHLVMPKVLAPRLELLGRFANALTEPDKRCQRRSESA